MPTAAATTLLTPARRWPRVRALVLASVTALLVGCLAPEGEPSEAAAAVLVAPDPIVEKHDHFDPAEHAVAWNAEELAWMPFAAEGERSGAHALDVHGTTLALAVNGDKQAVVLFDVTTPENPVVLGMVEDPRLDGDDRTIAFSDDGLTVFLGTSKGIAAIDVTHPDAPEIVAEYENPQFGAHTLFAHAAGGSQFVDIIGGGLVVVEYDTDARRFSLAGRYAAATPQQMLLAMPGGVTGDATTYAVRDVYGHDVFVETDPDLGKTIAYVAYAYEGLKIVDITNPATPLEIGTWIPEDEGAPFYVHTIEVTHREDGRRIAVVGSEVFENRHVDTPSPVWVLDVTDLAAPQLLATWTNPGGHGSDSLFYSAHDLRVAGDDLFLAHYHAGAFVLDLAKLIDGDVNATRAVFTPHGDNGWRPEESGCCFGFNMNGVPMAFDVLPVGDVVYVADYHSGFYAYRVGA